jgi:DNA-binding transcriptional LysR family regulator
MILKNRIIKMRRITFDLDVLRTFATGMELGSFAKAADRLGRSTSAVSAQLKKLEQQAETPIFIKAGRGLALTDAGETMLAYARRLLDLNDEAATAIHGTGLEGWVRLGLQEDFGETILPEVLGQFARAHPKVRIEARVARNAELIDRVTSGRLDLALAWSAGAVTPHCQRVMDVPMCWVGPAREPKDWMASADEPLPLAALEARQRTRSTAREFHGGWHLPAQVWRACGRQPQQGWESRSVPRLDFLLAYNLWFQRMVDYPPCRLSDWSFIARKRNPNPRRRAWQQSCCRRCTRRYQASDRCQMAQGAKTGAFTATSDAPRDCPRLPAISTISNAV